MRYDVRLKMKEYPVVWKGLPPKFLRKHYRLYFSIFADDSETLLHEIRRTVPIISAQRQTHPNIHFVISFAIHSDGDLTANPVQTRIGCEFENLVSDSETKYLLSVNGKKLKAINFADLFEPHEG